MSKRSEAPLGDALKDAAADWWAGFFRGLGCTPEEAEENVAPMREHLAAERDAPLAAASPPPAIGEGGEV